MPNGRTIRLNTDEIGEAWRRAREMARIEVPLRPVLMDTPAGPDYFAQIEAAQRIERENPPAAFNPIWPSNQPPLPSGPPQPENRIEELQAQPLDNGLLERIQQTIIMNSHVVDDFELIDRVRDMLENRRITGLLLERYINYASEWMKTNLKRGDSPNKAKTEVWLDKTFRQAYKSKKVKSVQGEIGLEIEAEGKNLFTQPIQWWQAVADGSLRSTEGHPPIEYVLRQPIDRRDVKPALEYLVHQLRKSKSELMMSHRTSVHVHVNIQQMKMLDIMKFMSLYYVFENLLLEWSGPDRKGNMFCLRAADASYQIELLTEALKTGSWAKVMSQDYRYASMNTASMGNHGSLEFRSMMGTVDLEAIQDWVSILTALKDAAIEFKSPESIGRMVNNLGGKNFLVKVFDGRVHPRVLKKFLGYDDLENMIHDSFIVMKDMLYAIDWTDPPKWMTKVTEPKTAGNGWDE